MIGYKPLKIGSLLIDPPVLSAPMAGYTNYAYRQLLRKLGGVGLIATEMVSARSFVYLDAKGDDHPARLWGIESEDRPLAVQIWDNLPETMAQTASRLVTEYKVSVIDINFGCPAPQIAGKSASGSWLLRFPEKVAAIVESVVAATGSVRVTAKIRLGLTNQSINAVEVAQAVEEAGASAITVHGRTAAQFYSGQANWEEIARIKPYLKKIPLIGNGDIRTVEEAIDRLQNGSVDGIMIGRGGIDRPWLFRQIAQALRGEPVEDEPTVAEQKELLLRLYHLVTARFGAERSLLMMRRYACHFSKGKNGARTFRAQVSRANSEEEFFRLINEFGNESQ